MGIFEHGLLKENQVTTIAAMVIATAAMVRVAAATVRVVVMTKVVQEKFLAALITDAAALIASWRDETPT